MQSVRNKFFSRSAFSRFKKESYMQPIFQHGVKLILYSILFAVYLTSSVTFGHLRAESEVSAFFSQGQSILNPQDSAQSRKQAIQNFQIQAVGQAVSVILTPSRMATEMASLQEKVFNAPERYINDYQIFSESSAEGMYQVTGQVSISMELLKRDLLQHGMIAQTQPSEGTDPVSEPNEPAANTGTEDEQESKEAARGLVLSKPEVLWAVTENVGGEWRFPGDSSDHAGLVASSVAQEVQDFDWSLRPIQSNELEINEQGNVSLTQAVNLAKKLRVGNVVVGTIVYQASAEGETGRLTAYLRLLDVSSGRLQGEVRKEVPSNDELLPEAAIKLANAVVPELDGLMKQPLAAVEVPRSVAPMVEEPGEWTLRIRSNQQIVYWEAIDRILKERFKSVQVKSLEFGGNEGVVVLSGIDGSALESLDGTQLPGGVQMQASGSPSQSNTLVITFIKKQSGSNEF